MFVLKKYEEYFESIKGKKVGFLGVGVSNLPLAFMYLERGFEVSVRDRRSAEQLGDTAKRLTDAGARLILGDGYLEGIYEDILFRSPGMKYHLPELCKAREAGVTVTGEIEMFFELCPCKIFAITGSDGKTTTTTIISKMLEDAGKRVFLGGNIGTPLFPQIAEVGPDDVAVVELSSFQLISMKRSPDVAVITNISPNHLDIHKDMDEYVNAKKNIFLHQTKEGRTVLNLRNDYTRSFAAETVGECVFFSRTDEVAGAWCDADGNMHSGGSVVMNAREIRVPGAHNVENYLAAFAALEGYVPHEVMASVARSFPGVEHRLELVCEGGGVRWYNDSKATTPTSGCAALRAMGDTPVLLIAGGSDKQTPFEPFAEEICRHVRLLILAGHTAPKIEAAVRGCSGFDSAKLQIITTSGMEESVSVAAKNALSGEAVVLSPACASFDFYSCYEERGEHFKKLALAACKGDRA